MKKFSFNKKIAIIVILALVLCAAVLSACDLFEARQLAKFGQKKAGKIFTKENASNLVYKLYQQLLN